MKNHESFADSSFTLILIISLVKDFADRVVIEVSGKAEVHLIVLVIVMVTTKAQSGTVKLNVNFSLSLQGIVLLPIYKVCVGDKVYLDCSLLIIDLLKEDHLHTFFSNRVMPYLKLNVSSFKGLKVMVVISDDYWEIH